MAERKRLKVFKTSDLVNEATALSVGDTWVTEAIPCTGAKAVLAILNSANGDATHGVTTLVGQVSVDRAFTVPVAVGSTVGMNAGVVAATPCFLLGGQGATWVGGASQTTALGSPWPFFRLTGTADATNGACTTPVVDVVVN